MPVTGRFELHIFVGPLAPDEETIARFRAACAAADPPMKPLLLALDYVGRGFVPVLQSSRYVEGDEATARAAAERDAAILRDAGLAVLREKVEAMADAQGVPNDAADVAAQTEEERAAHYFEFHLLVDKVDGSGLSESDMLGLREVAERYSLALHTPVPLSYNVLKPGQRFLNLRARRIGLSDAEHTVAALERAITVDGTLAIKKRIAEYICFDSNRALDNGWLEPA